MIPVPLAQAPGFYRFAIGAFRAAIVSDGPLMLPEPRRIFPDMPADMLRQCLDDAVLPHDSMRLEQNALLLDTGEHLALFDTGMGASKRFGPHAGRLVQSLAEAGVAPGDITAVVLTHAHSDHCWGTALADGTPVFPNARIYISSVEMEFWLAQPASRPMSTAAGVRRHLLPLRDHIQLIDDGEEVLPGVRAMASPGHTVGHMCFAIGSAGEQAMVIGDLAFHHALSFAHPDVECAFDEDRAEAARMRLRILSELAAQRMRLIGYHQPFPGIGYAAKAGAAFRWVAEPMRLEA